MELENHQPARDLKDKKKKLMDIQTERLFSHSTPMEKDKNFIVRKKNSLDSLMMILYHSLSPIRQTNKQVH